MELVWIILLIVCILVVMATINSICRHISQNIMIKNNKKAIANSSGAEKIRLILRADLTPFLDIIKEDEKQDVRIASALFISLHAQKNLADSFYGALNGTQKHISTTEVSAALSNLEATLSEDEEKKHLLAVRLFGVAFGIVLVEAATATNSKVNKKMFSRLVSSYQIDDHYKKELAKMTTTYINYSNDPSFDPNSRVLPSTSRDFGIIGYSLLDLKLPNGKFASQEVCIPLTIAIDLVRKSVINELFKTNQSFTQETLTLTVKQLQDAKLI